MDSAIAGFGFMVFNTTFNNISVIEGGYFFLLVEEIRVQMYPEKTTNLSQITDKLYHNYHTIMTITGSMNAMSITVRTLPDLFTFLLIFALESFFLYYT